MLGTMRGQLGTMSSRRANLDRSRPPLHVPASAALFPPRPAPRPRPPQTPPRHPACEPVHQAPLPLTPIHTGSAAGREQFLRRWQRQLCHRLEPRCQPTVANPRRCGVGGRRRCQAACGGRCVLHLLLPGLLQRVPRLPLARLALGARGTAVTEVCCDLRDDLQGRGWVGCGGARCGRGASTGRSPNGTVHFWQRGSRLCVVRARQYWCEVVVVCYSPRETASYGRPRLRPRVSLSVCVCLQ